MLKHVLDWIQIRKDSQASLWRRQFEADIDRFELRKFFDALDGVGDLIEVRGERFGSTPSTSSGTSSPTELRAECLELREGTRRMLEDILAPKQVRHYESRFLAHLNILRMIWNNRWKYRYYSETNAFAIMWRYVYGHFFDRDVPR